MEAFISHTEENWNVHPPTGRGVKFIGYCPEPQVVKPTVLSAVGRRGLEGVLGNLRSCGSYGLP